MAEFIQIFIAIAVKAMQSFEVYQISSVYQRRDLDFIVIWRERAAHDYCIELAYQVGLQPIGDGFILIDS